MKKSLVFLVALCCLYTKANAQQDVLSTSFIKSIADKVNQYQLANPWTERDDNWIRGTYYSGVMAMYMATKDEANTTRARANLLRAYFTQNLYKDPFSNDQIYEILREQRLQ